MLGLPLSSSLAASFDSLLPTLNGIRSLIQDTRKERIISVRQIESRSERPLGGVVLLGHERLVDEPDREVTAQDTVCTEQAPVSLHPSMTLFFQTFPSLPASQPDTTTPPTTQGLGPPRPSARDTEIYKRNKSSLTTPSQPTHPTPSPTAPSSPPY